MRRRHLLHQSAFSRRQKADQSKWTLQGMKSKVLRRLIQLSKPETIPHSSGGGFVTTRWGWVGIAALIEPGESPVAVESVLKALVEDKIVLQRYREGAARKFQVTIA